MSERHGYESGVPCWVATIQPDPEAAAAFYGALFGWGYEDGGGFLLARLRGRDVAAVAPLPPWRRPAPAARLDHGHLGRQRGRGRAHGARRRR